MFEVNNRNTRYAKCSKSTIKTSEQHNWLSTCISEKYSVNIRRAEK